MWLLCLDYRVGLMVGTTLNQNNAWRIEHLVQTASSLQKTDHSTNISETSTYKNHGAHRMVVL